MIIANAVSPAIAGAALAGAALNAVDLAAIRGGGLCVKEHWVGRRLRRALRADILRLAAEGSFRPSGLTPRLAGAGASTDDELFGESDRRVCVLSDDDVGGDSIARRAIVEDLERVCEQLRADAGLGREGLALGEMYYSLSGAGTASLPLHLDEHHPATKHAPPSDASHWRSVSFLLYLSDASTLGGGAFRAFHRADVNSLCRCGAHSGNLQVGWLESEEGGGGGGGSSLPVFLDAWVPPAWMDERNPERSAVVRWEAEMAVGDGPDAAEERFYEACQPRSQLYTAPDDGSHPSPLADMPIDHDDPDFAGASLDTCDFVERLRARLREPYRRGFGGLTTSPEDDERDDARRRWSVVDVEAVGGTLLLFDSVCVPHLVLPVTAGQRLALGGWFHEPSEEYAVWYDSAFAVCAPAEGDDELSY